RRCTTTSGGCAAAADRNSPGTRRLPPRAARGMFRAIMRAPTLYACAAAAAAIGAALALVPAGEARVGEAVEPTVEETAAAVRHYQTLCLPCHGSAGAGDGPAAPWLWPRPRDFTRAEY